MAAGNGRPPPAVMPSYCPELAELSAKGIHAPWLAKSLFGMKPHADYPAPIVDHAVQRLAALALFKRNEG